MNCAIYIRKSREDKNKPAHRLTVQRQQLPDHAKAQGWLPVIYDDGHASAARGKTEDLQQRNQLETDIRSGKINIILTIELSRLSRDDSMQDYTAWLHLCSQHRVKLATMSRILDPAQHSDWMLLLMEGGFSSVEMRVLQARMKEGRAQAYRAGKYLSGRPPMPYIYDKQLGGLRVDPDQLETFNTVVKMAQRQSIRSIADKLKLPLNKIRRLAADDRLLFYQSKRIDPQTGQEIDGQWPAVLTADQAEAIRKNRRAGHTNPRRKVNALLSGLGLLQCHYCGKALRTWTNGNPRNDGTKAKYYGCPTISNRSKCSQSRMVPQAAINKSVLTNFVNTVSDPDLKNYWLNSQTLDDTASQIADIELELSSLQAKKTRLVNAIAEDVIDFSDAKQKRQEIDAATNTCKKRLAELNSQTIEEPDWDAINLTAEEVEEATEEERRELLQAAIEKIDVTRSVMFITYKFPRNASGNKTAEIRLPKPARNKSKKINNK